jgi:2-succinyl-6-hydroxy-2,4-cyclohexadiene-1-carboxylate synthase
VSSPLLAFRRVGRPGGDPLVLLHGFTQTSWCWSPIDAELATDHELLLVDAPGHGASADVSADLWGAGRAVADVGGAATYLGYSMGGRIALHAALDRPDVVRRLVLVSATGGMDDASERAARRTADERLADRVLDLGVEAFVDEWLAQPLFSTLAPERTHRSARLANTAAGLASSLRQAGTGTQEPLWDRLGELEIPVLVVAGALDARFVGLAHRLADAIGPSATLVVVPGAGHTVHLEQPERFTAALRDWLASSRAQ